MRFSLFLVVPQNNSSPSPTSAGHRHFGTYVVYSNKEETLYGCTVATIGRVKKWAITYDRKAYVIQDRTVLLRPTMNNKTLVWVPAILLTLWGAGDTKAWIQNACRGARVISSRK